MRGPFYGRLLWVYALATDGEDYDDMIRHQATESIAYPY